MRSSRRKGIATETIFYIIIGIAVVSLVVLLVVNYSRTARDEGACRTSQDRFCEAFAASNYGAHPDWDTPTEISDKFTGFGPPANCNQPSELVCRSRGYVPPEGGTTLPQCNDGVDNDGDGLTDFGSAPTNDPQCASASDNSESL